MARTQNDSPIPGALVEARPDRTGRADEPGVAFAVSDREGRFVLTALEPEVLYRLAAAHPDRVPARREVVTGGAGEPSRRVALELAESRPVHGVAVDEQGRPVAGAEVVTTPASDEVVVSESRRGTGRTDRWDRATARTGADGRFRVSAPPARVIDLAVRKDGYEPALRRRVTIETARPSVDLGPIVLPSAASLHGRVTARDGTPLAGARVWVFQELDGRPETLIRRAFREPPTTEAGPGGAFELRDLPASRPVHLVADVSGYLPAVRVGVRPDDPPPTLRLEPALRLAGQVVDVAGEPVPGARLDLEPARASSRIAPDRRLGSTLTVFSDGAGEFEFPEVSPGRFDLSAQAASFLAGQPRRIVLRRQEAPPELEILAGAGRRDHGHRDRSAGRAGPAGAGGGREHGTSRQTVTTGRSGTFDFARLVQGRYQLRVERPGYQPVERLLDLAAGPDRTDEVVLLHPVAGFEAVVRLASGARPPHAILSVVDPSGRPVRSETRMLDATGRSVFSTLPASAPRIRVEAPGGAATVVSGPGAGHPLEVSLPPAAPLRVEIPALADSSTLAALTVTGIDGRSFEVVETSGIVRRRWNVVAGSGTVPNLPAGTWWLRATAADGRVWEGSVTTDGGPGGSMRLD